MSEFNTPVLSLCWCYLPAFVLEYNTSSAIDKSNAWKVPDIYKEIGFLTLHFIIILCQCRYACQEQVM